MTLVRWTPTADGLHREPDQLGYAYRVIDRIAWTRWLTDISGRPDPELEVVKRTLRVHQDAPAPRAPKAPAKPAVIPAVAVKPVPAPAAKPAEPTPVPAAVVPLATEPVAVATPALLDREVIRQAVLDLVAEKTGYPQDMLDPELDMEADLGVDTVKQAEIFAVIRETYSIHRDENLKLRDFPTINHVIGFVMDRATVPAPAAPGNGSIGPVPETTTVAAPVVPVVEAVIPAATEHAALPGVGLDREVIRQAVLDLVAEKTGYPQDMLDPELDMEADLGVDTVKQAEIFAVIRETYSIHRDENLKLRDFPTINHVIGFVMDRATAPAGTPTGNGSTPSVLEPAEATTVVETPTAIAPTPAEAAVPVTTAPVAPGGAGLDREVIRQAVLDLVAEKTGYPQDMLDPELDMEADLGVDTVKQAEIFAVIRETYGIHRDENLKLRDFPTINHVIGFVMDRATAPAGAPTGNGSTSPAPAPAAAATPVAASTAIAPAPAEDVVPATPAPGAGLDRELVRQAVLDLVAEKTGYPQDMLDPELDMEADLGVDTVKQAEIFAVIRETYGIHRDENLKLRDFPTINHVIGFVMDRATGDAQPRERDVVTAV